MILKTNIGWVITNVYAKHGLTQGITHARCVGALPELLKARNLKPKDIGLILHFRDPAWYTFGFEYIDGLYLRRHIQNIRKVALTDDERTRFPGKTMYDCVYYWNNRDAYNKWMRLSYRYLCGC